jgi:hypothetical protein
VVGVVDADDVRRIAMSLPHTALLKQVRGQHHVHSHLAELLSQFSKAASTKSPLVKYSVRMRDGSLCNQVNTMISTATPL